MFSPFRIGRVQVRPGHPLLMGVVNVTPDSFSDGGLAFKKTDAVRHALSLIAQGADMLDIGGESSRPGAKPVSLKEEVRRVIPVIEAIRKRSPIPISIDSCKPEVVRLAVMAGANLINDITGLSDPAMVATAAKLKKPVVVMHMQGNPRTMQKNPRYRNVVKEVANYLTGRAEQLEAEGITKVIIDPGIGFGKTVKHNLLLLKHTELLCSLGHPVLIGASRKSFIGKITGAKENGRLGGTLAAHLMTVMSGATIIRVHDVAEHRQALDIAIKIAGS